MTKYRRVKTDLEIQLEEEDQSSVLARGKRVRLLRNMTNLTRDEAASKYTNLNANTLKSWEIGREGGLTITGAKFLLEMAAGENIECTVEWLMYAIGEGPRLIPANYIAQQRRPYTIVSPSKQKQHIIDELRLFRVHHPEALELQVSDEGMYPSFRRGDYVAGVARYGTDIERVLQNICIVQLLEGSRLLRKLCASKTPLKYDLFCINYDCKDAELVLQNIELVCAAPVIWHRRLDENNEI